MFHDFYLVSENRLDFNSALQQHFP